MILKEKKVSDMTNKELEDLYVQCKNLMDKVERERDKRNDEIDNILMDIHEQFDKLHKLGYVLNVDSKVLNCKDLADLEFCRTEEFNGEGEEIIELVENG